MDRLTQETHPEGVDREILEMEEEADEDVIKEKAEKAREETERQLDNENTQIINELQKALNDESPEEKKERMIEEGKVRADVQNEVRKYKETLMGNSKKMPTSLTLTTGSASRMQPCSRMFFARWLLRTL